MITITEQIPKKLSGLTSFEVKFDYNQNIVETIKTFSPAIFDKTEKSWEVSSIYLSRLLDALTIYDNIQLKLLKESSDVIKGESDAAVISRDKKLNKRTTNKSTKEKESPKEDKELTEEEILRFKFRPFKHQIEAVNYGLQKKKWLNLSKMGLGKTYEAICLAETLYYRGLIEHCLIICGVDSLRTNWKKEIQQFSNLSCTVLGEYKTRTGKISYRSISERAEQLKNDIAEFFIIVNAATIRDDKIIDAFQKSRNKIDLIVVDEGHKINTKSSAQGNNLLKLDAKYKVNMSGSLVTNNPESCFLPLNWIDKDHSTLTNFKSLYCNFGGFNNREVISYKNLNLLQEELNDCSLVRSFEQVRGDMPEKVIEFETVEMSDEHSKFYEDVRNGVKEEVNKVKLTTGNLLALTTRLRQATVAPSILTTNKIESSKLERAEEIIEEIVGQGEKIVVFSTFIEPCNELYSKLSKFRPLLATGEISDDIVQHNIEMFRNSPDFNLLIGTHGKLGTGYSMPECHYSLMIDIPWSYYSFAQSCDRIYRITSNESVFIKVLSCAETIDERVREIVENKKELQEYLVDGKENTISEKLQEEMRNILFSL